MDRFLLQYQVLCHKLCLSFNHVPQKLSPGHPSRLSRLFLPILSATITPTSTLSPMRTTSLAASTSTTSVISSKTTATMTETSSSSTGTLPSVQPAGADPLVQALSTFSNTLVEAIQQQTFQIEMLRHTMSAILQRMEDRDSARQPAPAQSSSSERRSRLLRFLKAASFFKFF